MPDANDQLATVNRSGYPLQIAVANSVQARAEVHGWRVLYEEHAWRHPGDEDGGGFIDLVLENREQQVVLVIETKRVLNKEWILLPPDGNAKGRRHARGMLLEKKTRESADTAIWVNHALDPRTPEAAFCVMPKDARDPTVERIAAELISATEALADEERSHQFGYRKGLIKRSYFSLIVTTARLSVCSFAPGEIAIADGSIPSSARFDTVGAVRLTKQLSLDARPLDIDEMRGSESDRLAKAKERTVFLVNAEALDCFLCDFSVDRRAG